MKPIQYQILNDLTTKYSLNKCSALEELLQLEEHLHIKYLDKGFSKTYFYSALGAMVRRYKNE